MLGFQELQSNAPSTMYTLTVRPNNRCYWFSVENTYIRMQQQILQLYLALA